MTIILRHGGEAHVVRPDSVYRTSVLSPIVGYQPQADVQAVAAAFTLGPPSGMTLQGLYGLGAQNLPLFQRMWLRMKAWAARKKAERFMTAAQGGGGQGQVRIAMPDVAVQAPGPTTGAAAELLDPVMAGRAQGVFMIIGPPGYGPHGQHFLQRAARVAGQRRQSSLYYAG